MNEPHDSFSRTYQVEWQDIDFNGHMRNTAYFERASHLRVCFLSEHGFSAERFAQLRIGPVVFQDTMQYFKESHLMDSYRVHLQIAALSEDARRFSLLNRFFNESGEPLAQLQSDGAWLDLKARKTRVPPEELADAMKWMPRAESFQWLPAKQAR
ncbi:acyl-CoA thioesterase [Acanthopleuribacter pedis]|uniref:Thioesterase family protein n=1 Tax=Acanthopleuribacter pedis TaxID=442870 RepID=A0A8J7U727_9BACT|nr:thioesterase family protein [Acanthopleuribacter pedis]MBO1320976.1 thioesterase family protein [Acanthopleuribacter pedis]